MLLTNQVNVDPQNDANGNGQKPLSDEERKQREALLEQSRA